jgi:hypothetical protein
MYRMRGLQRIAVGILSLANLVVPVHAQRLTDREFLELASTQVRRYSGTFHDLTAEETSTIEFLDSSGKARSTRKVKSALIIYRSQANSKISTEYRDVEEVDGKPVKDHDQRAMKLFETLANAHSVADELDRITKEGSRYNDNVETVNITLNQGFPLRLGCRHKFQFGFIRDETVDSLRTRVYGYEQTEPCADYHYRLGLPQEFETGPKLHRGLLWLEESNGRLVREVRELYAQSNLRVGVEVKALHCIFDYGDSAFGIRTPRRIVIMDYALGNWKPFGPAIFETRPRMTITQEYGAFSRFEVSVEQKIAEPKEK